MLAEKIKYVDLDGNELEETFYFNLSKAELVELELIYGGIEDYMNRLIQDRNTAELVLFYKAFILKAYGKRAQDRKHFVKSQELRDKFEQTDAFSELFYKLVLDVDYAKRFLTGILPIGDGANLDKPVINAYMPELNITAATEENV